MNSGPYDFMPNYTWAMYYGNEPAGKGHELVCGGFADRWDCRYGEAETKGNEILHASFMINRKVTLYLNHNSMYMIEVRYAGKPDFWELCVNSCGMPGHPCCSETSRHKLEPEKIEEYLDKEFPNCKLWAMIKKRAKELYNQYLLSNA